MNMKIVTDTNTFLQRRMDYGRLRYSFIAVVLAGVGLALQPIAIRLSLGGDALIVENALNGMIATEVVSAVVLWLAFSTFFHLAATALGGHSSLGKLLKGVGLGFYPFILTGLSWSVGLYLSLRGAALDAQEDGTRGFFQNELNAIEAYLEHASGDPLLVVFFALGALLLLLSAHLWTIAIEESTGIARRRAAGVVAIPLLLYITWEASSYLI